MVSEGDVDACRRKDSFIATQLTPKISSSCATTAREGARSAKAAKIVDVFILSGVYCVYMERRYKSGEGTPTGIMYYYAMMAVGGYRVVRSRTL